jgi:hypothetical protein
MKERQAKKQLVKMLASLTPGSILHLLADAIRQQGDDARRADDKELHRQCKVAENALVVVGIGLDAILPQ